METYIYGSALTANPKFDATGVQTHGHQTVHALVTVVLTSEQLRTSIRPICFMIYINVRMLNAEYWYAGDMRFPSTFWPYVYASSSVVAS